MTTYDINHTGQNLLDFIRREGDDLADALFLAAESNEKDALLLEGADTQSAITNRTQRELVQDGLALGVAMLRESATRRRALCEELDRLLEQDYQANLTDE